MDDSECWGRTVKALRSVAIANGVKAVHLRDRQPGDPGVAYLNTTALPWLIANSFTVEGAGAQFQLSGPNIVAPKIGGSCTMQIVQPLVLCRVWVVLTHLPSNRCRQA